MGRWVYGEFREQTIGAADGVLADIKDSSLQKRCLFSLPRLLVSDFITMNIPLFNNGSSHIDLHCKIN